MTFVRRVAVLACALAVGLFAVPALAKKSKIGPPKFKPMKLFLAKGDADACGRGCRVWVAAEGHIDPGAGTRLADLLKSLPHPRPPIVFHSPGGAGFASTEIGNLLRANDMAASVGRTVQISNNARRGRLYRVVPRGAICASACVFALAGATQRSVAPESRIGVHAWRVYKKKLSKEETELLAERFRYYVIGKGVDSELVDRALKTPSSSMHWLSRAEMHRYGLLSTETFETPWRVLKFRNGSLTVKSLTREVNGSSLTTRIEFICDGAIASFSIQRDLAQRERENRGRFSIRLRWDGDAFWDLVSSGANSAENLSRKPALVLTSQMMHTAISSSRLILDERFTNIDQTDGPREFQVSTKGLGTALTAMSNCWILPQGFGSPSPAFR